MQIFLQSLCSGVLRAEREPTTTSSLSNTFSSGESKLDEKSEKLVSLSHFFLHSVLHLLPSELSLHSSSMQIFLQSLCSGVLRAEREPTTTSSLSNTFSSGESKLDE